MKRYKIRFFIWPYSNVKRDREDYMRENANTCNPEVEIKAESFDGAYRAAQQILLGILLDGRVWEAGLEKIEEVSR